MLPELLFQRSSSSEFNFTAGIRDAFFTIAEDEDPTTRGPHRPFTACSERAHNVGFEGADSSLSAAMTTLLPRVAQQERLLREGASHSLDNIDVNEHNIEHDNNIEYYNLENDNNIHNHSNATLAARTRSTAQPQAHTFGTLAYIKTPATARDKLRPRAELCEVIDHDGVGYRVAPLQDPSPNARTVEHHATSVQGPPLNVRTVQHVAFTEDDFPLWGPPPTSATPAA
jgi:hypothetical protein